MAYYIFKKIIENLYASEKNDDFYRQGTTPFEGMLQNIIFNYMNKSSKTTITNFLDDNIDE